MSQPLPRPGRSGKSLGGGFIAGLFGGAFGQLLYQLGPESPVLEAITRILGWTIIGAIFGGGMSLFVPNLRLLRSVAGGSTSRAIGAVGFLLAALAG